MSRFLPISLLLISATVAATTNLGHPHERSIQAALAPQSHSLLNDSYIIMLNHTIDKSLLDNHFNFLQTVHAEGAYANDVNTGVSQVYDGHVKGYAGRFTERTISRIRAMPEVLYIEKDQVSFVLTVLH